MLSSHQCFLQFFSIIFSIFDLFMTKIVEKSEKVLRFIVIIFNISLRLIFSYIIKQNNFNIELLVLRHFNILSIQIQEIV
jgi:hypothetical protein